MNNDRGEILMKWIVACILLGWAGLFYFQFGNLVLELEVQEAAYEVQSERMTALQKELLDKESLERDLKLKSELVMSLTDQLILCENPVAFKD